MTRISSLNKLLAFGHDSKLWHPAYQFTNSKIRKIEESLLPLESLISNATDDSVEDEVLDSVSLTISAKSNPVDEVLLDNNITPIVSTILEDNLLKPFSLSLSVSKNLLVIDTLSANVVDETVSLVMKLTTAIHGCQFGQYKVRFSTFNWPMHNHPYAPRDENSAKSILSDLLIETSQGCSFKDILICGDMSVRLVGDDSVIKHLFGISPNNIYRYDRISSLLFDVSKKKKLWELLSGD